MQFINNKGATLVELILFFVAVIALLLVILSPLASIWALNNLFPVLKIPYTFWTWLAVTIFESKFVIIPILNGILGSVIKQK